MVAVTTSGVYRNPKASLDSDLESLVNDHTDSTTTNENVTHMRRKSIGDDEEETEEGARFLPMEMGADPEAARSNRPSHRYVILMCVQFLFMVEVSAFIMEPPLQEIMEDFICHHRYPDHAMGRRPEGEAPDPRCREPGVQGTLAMTRSWMMTVGLLVPLLVQIPYGIAADKYGRRPILFLGLLGIVLSTACNVIVLAQPDIFSPWHLIVGPIPTILGGGAPTVTAMIWTILTDATPVETRTTLFYKMQAGILVLSAVCRPLAGWLMSIDPWLPMWIGLVALVLSLFSTLLVPETMALSRPKYDKLGDAHASSLPSSSRYGSGGLQAAWLAARKDILHVWNSILRSRDLMLLLTSNGLSFPMYVAFESNLLQYATARYNWDWSTAAYITTVNKVASIVVLVVFLPLCTAFINKRWALEPLPRDLLLGRGSSISMVAAAALASIAAAPWMLVVSLVVLSFGIGYDPQIRALLAAVVEADSLATLNTFISTIETVMGLVSIPSLGWLLSKGIELGGFWMGLPYLASAICMLLGTVTIFLFKIPPGARQAQAHHHH